MFQIGKNGLFKDVRNALFEGRFKVEGNPRAPELKPFIRTIMRKIPTALLKQAIAFAKWGKEEKKSEISLVLIDDRGKYSWKCPHQWNSAGHVCGHPELTADEFYGWIGDFHSHPDGFSQHSTTDERDERKRRNGIFIVTSGYTLMTARPVVVGMFEGNRFEVDLDDVFDLEKDEGEYTFPEEWKERVHGSPCEECAKNPPAPVSMDSMSVQRGFFRLPKAAEKEAKRKIVIELDEEETITDWLMKALEDWRSVDPTGEAVFVCHTPQCDRAVDLEKCTVCGEQITEEELMHSAAEVFEAAIELKMDRDAIVQEISETAPDDFGLSATTSAVSFPRREGLEGLTDRPEGR